MYARVRVLVILCVHMCIYAFVCVHVSILIYIYIPAGGGAWQTSSNSPTKPAYRRAVCRGNLTNVPQTTNGRISLARPLIKSPANTCDSSPTHEY